MIKNINNFLDKYNISINIVNNILYMDIQNHINNTKFNLIISHQDLIHLDINNIDILYLYLQKCFIKANNYNIYFYEHSTELVIEIICIDDDFIEKNFKLYLKYYNDYYEKIIEKQDIDDKLQNKDMVQNNNCDIVDIKHNYFINTIYEYFYNIVYVLNFLCINDDI